MIGEERGISSEEREVIITTVDEIGMTVVAREGMIGQTEGETRGTHGRTEDEEITEILIVEDEIVLVGTTK